MKRFMTVTAVTLLSVFNFLPASQANHQSQRQVQRQVPIQGLRQAAAPQALQRSEEVALAFDQMKFKPLMQGVSQNVLSGNPDLGSYLAITKFDAGTRHALHIHSNDIKVVVLKGTFVYKSDGEEKRLGAGSYLLIPGGKQHISGADENEDVYFVQQSEGKFDMTLINE